jgi:hypothetical protein
VRAPSEGKSDDSEDSFYKGLLNQFPKYKLKILLGDFNALVGRENILKPTTGNESLHQDSNNYGVRIVKFATSKNLVKNAMFRHRNVHNYTWNFLYGNTHKQILY